jgi:hypothetical protein
MKIRYLGQFSLSNCQFLFSCFWFRCVDWSFHSIDGSRVIISPIPPYLIVIWFVNLSIYIYLPWAPWGRNTSKPKPPKFGAKASSAHSAASASQ